MNVQNYLSIVASLSVVALLVASASSLAIESNYFGDDSSHLSKLPRYTQALLSGCADRLRFLKEPVISKGDAPTYRCLIVEDKRPSLSLRIVMTNPASLEYKYQYAENAVRKNLTEKQVGTISKLIDGAKFWEIPTENPNTLSTGTTWLIEGLKGSKYHFVVRDSESSGAVADLICELFRATGFKSELTRTEMLPLPKNAKD